MDDHAALSSFGRLRSSRQNQVRLLESGTGRQSPNLLPGLRWLIEACSICVITDGARDAAAVGQDLTLIKTPGAMSRYVGKGEEIDSEGDGNGIRTVFWPS